VPQILLNVLAGTFFLEAGAILPDWQLEDVTGDFEINLC
jgi:hypothetical protein